MTLDDVELREKHDDLLLDRSQIIYGEGVTNSGKSLIFGIAYMLRILEQPKSKTQFVLAGESVPVLERMYIQNEDSFYNLFSTITDYKKSGEGGAKITVQAPDHEKVIYLLGYDNRKRWHP